MVGGLHPTGKIASNRWGRANADGARVSRWLKSYLQIERATCEMVGLASYGRFWGGENEVQRIKSTT
jgi:hypothetical protein